MEGWTSHGCKRVNNLRGKKVSHVGCKSLLAKQGRMQGVPFYLEENYEYPFERRMMESINVFGTEYSLEYIDNPDTWMLENGSDAYCEFEQKRIAIFNGTSNDKNRLLEHELIHAHLYECGHRSDANNEMLVELMTEIFERIKGR